jgi:hypothetical protein
MANSAKDEEPMKFGARHLRRALSNEHLDPALSCAMTPRKLETHAMRQVDALGVTLQIKRRSAIDPSRALAGPGKIYLPRSFKKAATRNRAGLLLHELVHVRQWRKEGTLRMAARYAFAPRWRAAYEIEAHAETFRAHASMGWTRKDALKWRTVYITRIHKTYFLGVVDFQEFAALCIRAWEIPKR